VKTVKPGRLKTEKDKRMLKWREAKLKVQMLKQSFNANLEIKTHIGEFCNYNMLVL